MCFRHVLLYNRPLQNLWFNTSYCFSQFSGMGIRAVLLICVVMTMANHMLQQLVARFLLEASEGFTHVWSSALRMWLAQASTQHGGLTAARLLTDAGLPQDGIPKGQAPTACQASAVPMVKVSHMAKLSISVDGSYTEAWMPEGMVLLNVHRKWCSH